MTGDMHTSSKTVCTGSKADLLHGGQVQGGLLQLGSLLLGGLLQPLHGLICHHLTQGRVAGCSPGSVKLLCSRVQGCLMLLPHALLGRLHLQPQECLLS